MNFRLLLNPHGMTTIIPGGKNDGEDCTYSTGKFGKIYIMMIQKPKEPSVHLPKDISELLRG